MRQFLGGIMVILTLVALVWDQSYTGRQALVASNREGCERSAQNLAAEVNFERLEQQANQAAAVTPGVAVALRRERSAISRIQERGLLVLDSHIDRGVWRLLVDSRDRRAVRTGPFRCNKAFPSASPWQFGF